MGVHEISKLLPVEFNAPIRRIKQAMAARPHRSRVSGSFGMVLGLLVVVSSGLAQVRGNAGTEHTPPSEPPLPVNWLYGAYVPKNVALTPLNGSERFKLYVRQSFTTPGTYIKTGIFSIRDQIINDPEQWGDGIQGYGKRVASREAQFVLQNSISSLGDAVLRYEPRYDRCRCDGVWLRTRHVIIRNFVTYNQTEHDLRPRIPLYAAAFGSGAITAAWQPGSNNLLVKGYQSAITQAGVGIAINWIGEFAPEIKRILRKSKKQSQ